MIFRVAPLLVLALLANDASAVDLSGQSTATPLLKSDILKALLPMASAMSHCNAIESVQMSVETIPSDVKTNASGVVISGSPNIERWVATGCGTSVAFKVTLTPDGAGGEFYSISAIK